MASEAVDVKIGERYTQLESKRSEVLERARECAKLTIPSLMPPDGHDEQTRLYKPYQSMGARGVNNLSSKLMLTLLPPNSPFFKFTIDPALVEDSGQDDAEMNSTLAEMESILVRDIESSGDRVATFQWVRLLVVTGNALLYFPPTDQGGGMKVYKLDQYVVVRDPLGNILELIIKEQIAPQAIKDEAVKAKVLVEIKKNEGVKNYVDLFTRAVLDRDTNKWLVTQEVNNEPMNESAGEFEKDDLPYLALRWNALANEDYGRGHTDEAIGDLRSLEGLSQARQEAVSASAKVVFFVDPNGTVNSTKLANAENLEVIEGRADEVTVLQTQKTSDLQVVRESILDIKQDLAYHYLLNSSIQRNAERVTAEEIRTMAQELEDSLGGTYTVLSQEFQKPYVKIKIVRMTAEGKFPEDAKEIDPVITTGLDGLGRGQDYNKISQFLAGVSQLGEQAVKQINYNTVVIQLATAVGLKAEDYVISQEQQAKTAQDEQVSGVIDKATGPVAGAMAKGMVEQGTQEGV
jgi:hypothetical protein